MSDEPDPNPEEFVNWLCWMWAQDGERFYPPEETARECTEEWVEGDESLDKQRVYLKEYGQHARAYSEAVSKFRDAKRRGFNPVECAAREQHKLRQQSDEYNESLDWSWLKDGETYIDSLAATFDNEG
jgi:hypothetical protein